MRRTKLALAALIGMMLNGCAYTPVIDTAGRSGTYSEDRAREITNDLQHCQQLAEDNARVHENLGKLIWNNWTRALLLYIPPEQETDYKKTYRKCMLNRGHSVVN